MSEQPTGTAFQLGLTVQVPRPAVAPANITMQPAIREWLDAVGITEWELRWAEIDDDLETLHSVESRCTLDTFLIFKKESDAVLFKMTFAGQLKGNPKQRPSSGSVILNNVVV